MNKSKLMNLPGRFGLAAALMALACALQGHQVFAQKSSGAAQNPSDAKVNSPASAVGQAPDDDRLFKGIYQEFYDTYRLGPADEIAIRVIGQPDYSLERVKVSPMGAVYHPLLGDLEVAGLTVPQLIDRLTKDLSEYLIDPKVSVALVEAGSAKIGVLGEVVRPGVLVMYKPMNLLEAIAASGGFTDTGSKSGVTVLRQMREGGALTLKVNVERILEGKARPEENIAMQAGDIVLIHGNAKKKLNTVLSLAGFGSFLSFISMGGR
jgi:protein involved in polysaccharide export with SLBB domain